MNRIHRKICQSDKWANAMHSQLMPWAVGDVPLDGDVLELGPGYGITTSWLARHGGNLTAVEVDPALAADLRRRFDGEVDSRTSFSLRHNGFCALAACSPARTAA